MLYLCFLKSFILIYSIALPHKQQFLPSLKYLEYLYLLILILKNEVRTFKLCYQIIYLTLHIYFILGKTGSQIILPWRGDDARCWGMKPSADLGQLIMHVSRIYRNFGV